MPPTFNSKGRNRPTHCTFPIHPQQSSDTATIEAKVSVHKPGSLTTEFVKLLNYNDTLATPALKLLNLYFYLWEYYVVKSAEKIRLEEEQRQLQESNDWLASDSDILLQLYNKQSSGIPTPPPCLATNFEHPRQILSDTIKPAGYKTLGSSLIEYLFHPTYDKLLAFKWTGPDPLSMSTQASDLFLYMSAFTFPNEVH
ncbi:hypothetical protein MYU51_018319 [Penicillium brevicompactum]